MTLQLLYSEFFSLYMCIILFLFYQCIRNKNVVVPLPTKLGRGVESQGAASQGAAYDNLRSCVAKLECGGAKYM